MRRHCDLGFLVYPPLGRRTRASVVAGWDTPQNPLEVQTSNIRRAFAERRRENGELTVHPEGNKMGTKCVDANSLNFFPELVVHGPPWRDSPPTDDICRSDLVKAELANPICPIKPAKRRVFGNPETYSSRMHEKCTKRWCPARAMLYTKRVRQSPRDEK